MSQNLIGQTLFKRYRIFAFIASGSMGAVYQAIDIQSKTQHVLKSLQFEITEDSHLLEHVKQRAAELQNLQHTGIISCQGLLQDEHGIFLLQDYIDGPSLKSVLRKQSGHALPLMQALTCLKSVCSALDYAHACGIVHGDVRPENILIDRQGHLYLSDFSLTSDPIISSGQCYRAPEQLPGQDHHSTVDIYAAGMLFYELLSGKRPSCPPDETFTPADLSCLEEIENVNDRLVKVIEQALSTNAAARQNSAAELFTAACLAAGISEDDVPDDIELDASNYASVERNRMGKEKKGGIPVLFFLGGGAALLYIALLAGLAIVKWILPQFQTGSTIVSPVSMNPRVVIVTALPSDTATVTVTPTVTQTPIPSATPTSIATPMGGGSGVIAFAGMVKRIPQIFLADLNQEDVIFTQLTYAAGGACQPDWSPDGQQIVYISPCDGPHYYENYEGASLYIMDADGTGQIRVPIPSALGDFDPAWSPDGKKIAFAGAGRLKTDFNGHLYIYDIEEQTLLSIQENIAVREPQWSPDGSQIVFEMSRGNQTWIVNADGSGKETIFTSSNLVAYTPNYSPDGQYIYFGQERNPMLVYKSVDERAAQANVLLELTYYRPAWCPDFSPDGNYLVFADSDEDSIFTYHLGGDKWDVEELAPGFSPAWRP